MQITQRNPLVLFSFLLLYRLICSSLTRNYEYPDQYWQGPQVAHRLYFGYGYLTWEWTMDEPLRNPLYPYLLTLGYWFNIGVWSVQALFATAADFALVKILQNIFGVFSGHMAIVIFTNWYYASTLTRTYANSFETCLTLISFYLWISGQRMGSTNWKDFVSRGLVCLSYVARPTSIMIWAIIWPYELVQILRVFGFSWKAINFVFKNVSTIIFMFVSSFVIGSTYYGKPILTELNFLKYNFVEKWSQLYGKQSFLFYFGLSIPFIMGLGVVLLLISIAKLLRESASKSSISQEKSNVKIKCLKIILFVSFTYLLISSFSTHKQHRFIFPIIPLLLILSCYAITNPPKIFIKYAKLLIFMIFLFNLAMLALFSVYGKSDSVSVWNFIRQEMDLRKMNESNTVVIVLGQSHFIPGVSMLHRNVTYQIPDSSALKMSKNQSQNLLLSSNPMRVYEILTRNQTLKADFIIVQGKYMNNFSQFLNERNYEKVKEWRHCNIPEQTFIDYDSICIFLPQDRGF